MFKYADTNKLNIQCDLYCVGAAVRSRCATHPVIRAEIWLSMGIHNCQPPPRCLFLSQQMIHIVEQEPDKTVDDYDPYRADWTAPNSRYGSCNSLNKGYPEGTLKSNKSQPKSYHLGYDNDDYAPDQHNRSYSTLQTR
ncbi:unnamed protein product, partial [Medioppia subpectinata]